MSVVCRMITGLDVRPMSSSKTSCSVNSAEWCGLATRLQAGDGGGGGVSIKLDTIVDGRKISCRCRSRTG